MRPPPSCRTAAGWAQAGAHVLAAPCLRAELSLSGPTPRPLERRMHESVPFSSVRPNAASPRRSVERLAYHQAVSLTRQAIAFANSRVDAFPPRSGCRTPSSRRVRFEASGASRGGQLTPPDVVQHQAGGEEPGRAGWRCPCRRYPGPNRAPPRRSPRRRRCWPRGESEPADQPGHLVRQDVAEQVGR